MSMREYQERYIENTKKIKELFGRRSGGDVTEEQFYESRRKGNEEIFRLRKENMEILRKCLIPLLDDILSADGEDIRCLEAFADRLAAEQMDSGIRYLVCNSLVAYARVKGDRDLLIKELYLTAMAVYSYQVVMSEEVSERFQWRTRMLFGEAAGYIRFYDEIESTQTRGYIHRAMGNIALSYTGLDQKSAVKKLEVLRRSLQILTDPAYHQKTPDLPWDLYIYKSHQERTTLLTYFRSGEATVQELQEVMESAQFVYDTQLKNAERRGTPMQPQWEYVYAAVSYHCGVCTLQDFCQNLERIYSSVSSKDYSQQGMYANVYLPAVYAHYMRENEGILEKKKPVLLTMYRRLVRYVKNVRGDELSEQLFFYIRCCLDTYIEFPGENSFRDFVEEFVAGKQPEFYAHSLAVARGAEVLLDRALEEMPEVLLGVRGCASVEELRACGSRLRDFICNGAILHDIGKMKLMNLYEAPGRGRIGVEEELHRMHSLLGYRILERCDSTRDYAAAALGHHTWYDGQGGYPGEYRREEIPDAPLVDILSLVDYMDRSMDMAQNEEGGGLSPEEIAGTLGQLGGTRFAPHFVRLALENRREIFDAMETGRREACGTIYREYRAKAREERETLNVVMETTSKR